MGNLFIVSRLNVLLLCLDWLVSIACQRDIHNNLTKRCENQKKKEKSEKFSPSCFFRQLFVVETSQTRTKEEPKEHCRLKCPDAFASPENETYIVNCGRAIHLPSRYILLNCLRTHSRAHFDHNCKLELRHEADQHGSAIPTKN